MTAVEVYVSGGETAAATRVKALRPIRTELAMIVIGLAFVVFALVYGFAQTF